MGKGKHTLEQQLESKDKIKVGEIFRDESMVKYT
jgi:hypothetical protein